MSVLVVQLVPQGILFGADRNVTWRTDAHAVIRQGQTPRPKVMAWPNRDILIGYAGVGALDDEPTDRWLYRFIGRHLEEPIEDVARALTRELQPLALPTGEPLLSHIGGFEATDGHWLPRVWYVRNAWSLNPSTGVYGDIRPEFQASEEIAQPHYFGGLSAHQLRDRVERLADAWKPFWLHQGLGLATFNTLEQAMREAMRAVVETHPLKPHPRPASLEDWEKHLRMAIGTYGAYFEAFYLPFEQYVGGGSDVVWVPWPPDEQ